MICSVRGCGKIINVSLKFVHTRSDGDSLVLIGKFDDFGDETVGGRILDFPKLKVDWTLRPTTRIQAVELRLLRKHESLLSIRPEGLWSQ